MKILGRKFLDKQWDTTPETLKSLRQALQELGSVDFKFYKSKFHRWSYENETTQSEPAEADECNHIDILLNGTIIAQFYRRYLGFSGVLLEDNIPSSFQEKVESILADHKYCVGRGFSPRQMRLFNLFFGVAFSAIGCLFAYLALSTPKLIEGFPPEAVQNMSPETVEFLSSTPDTSLESFLAVCWIIIGGFYLLMYWKVSFRSRSTTKL